MDHLVRMVQHYGDVKGGLQAGAVTYFAFLSLFPILALAFFAVGLLSQVYPDARANLIEAINGVLPGLIGEGDGQLSLADHRGLGGHGRPARSPRRAVRRPRLALRHARRRCG